MMRRFLLLGLFSLSICSGAVASTETEAVEAVNDNRVAANLKQARFLMNKGDYVGAKKCLERALNLEPGNSEAQSLMRTCNQKVEQQLRKQQQQKDDELWQAAKRQNTKAAYENYQRQSTLKSYWADAEKAIRNFESIDAWQSVKNTTSVDELESFIRKYPESDHLNDAKYSKFIIQGEKYYRQRNMSAAFECYEEAQRLKTLTGEAAKHYNEVKLDRDFEAIKYSNDEDALKSFLREIPYTKSSYRNTISDRIAIIKSQNFTTSSSDYEFNQALAYATNSYTRRQVETRIDNVKAEKKRERRRHLRYAHQEWWNRNSLFGIGIDYNMLGNTLSWKAGLRYRLGTSEDVFNISIGADYVWHYAYTEKGSHYNYYTGENTPDISTDFIAGFVEVPLTMKFNFADGYRERNWYVGVSGIYGFRIDRSGDYDVEKNSIAIEPCLGYNWKKFDLGLSYKHYFQGFRDGDGYRYIDKDIDNDRIGMYMILYF